MTTEQLRPTADDNRTADEIVSYHEQKYGVVKGCDELRIRIAHTVAILRERLINTPELKSFSDGVVLEALHQRDRWGPKHDAEKTPFDWFWLMGFLTQKAAQAEQEGDHEKALHHTISSAAVLANWHALILKKATA